jgi:excisionase family DNA binding protein
MSLSEEEIQALPVLLTVVQAATALGIGRTVAYRLVRSGDWPTPVIRVGQQYRIPRAPLLRLMGLSTASPAGSREGSMSGTLIGAR